MKKGNLILIGLLFGIFLISFVSAEDCYDASVTPRPLCSCEDLQKMRLNRNANYILMDNIECSDTVNWNSGDGFIPISTGWSETFYGQLDGDGHIVSNLHINKVYTYGGIFGNVINGVIKNIGFKDVNIVSGNGASGGLVGNFDNGLISEVYITGVLREGPNNIVSNGGLVGLISSNVGGPIVQNCYARTDLINTRSQHNAGFVGRSYSWTNGRAIVKNSYSTGRVLPSSGVASGFCHRDTSPNDKAYYYDNFWDTGTSGLTTNVYGGVTGKSTGDMKEQSTFTNWDFGTIWAIDSGINDGYPYLQWEDVCVPNCAGRECGPDPTCGTTVCPPGCTNPHGTTSCNSGGTCVPLCETGYGDCDGITTNGCETNLLTDDNNCGVCGNPCNPGWSCVNGICQLPPPTSNICTNGPDDIIIKLFSEENSQGALWDDTHGYNWEICYYDIFGASTGSEPHPPTCLNPVLWLSSTYNAHASISEDSIYTIPVCYGDLDCVEDSSTGDACTDIDREIVVRLSDVTNAHISSESDSDFPIKICCKEIPSCIPDCTVIECGPDPVCGVECGPCDTGAGEVCDLGTGTCVPSIGVPYWADMNGDMINQSDLNDLVKLIAQGLGLPGKEINYSIYIKNALVFDWLWPDYKIFTASSEEEFTTWRAGKNKDEDLAEGEYYFEINIGGIIQSTKDNSNSDYHFLTVSDTENNNPPVANITSPKRGEVYLQENNVSFNQTSYDIDDYINYTWNLDDGIEIKGSTKDNPPSNYSFNYTYDSSGKKDISLNVLDERGLTDRDLVSILILDEGDYIFADIKEPELEAVFENKLVNFNASYTYAININRTNGLNITCLGGSCPATTANGTVIDLNGMVGNYSALNFSWVFSNGETHIYSGSDGVQFKKRFENADEYTADLTVNLLSNHSVISNAQTKFRIRLRSECTDNGEKFWDAEGESHDTLIEAGIWCVGVDGVPWDGVSGINDDCCPTDLFCNESALNHGCQDNPEIETWCKLNNINRCEDYPDEDNCTSDFCSKGGSAACGSLTICNGNVLGFLSECNVQCEWNGTRCRQVDNIILTTTLAGESESVSKCVYGVSRGDCNEDMGTMWVDQSGDMEWNQTALDKVKVYLISERGLIGANDNDARVFLDTECNINSICISEEGYRICGARLRKLGFFGGIHLIIALFAISIIYYFWILKDKSKKNRK